VADVADLIVRQTAAWQRFCGGGAIEEGTVRPEVAASWRRCRDGGLDPRAPKEPPKIAREHLAAVRMNHRPFVDAALPFMEFLRTAIRGSGFVLVLTDATGIVIELFGDAEQLFLARENNFVPGCSRAEEDVGTNAIGLALKEGRAVQLAGPEHWNVRHHRWTCASAPVFSPTGELLGTVTLSGESIRAHPHTLGMVISAAEAILEKLREREANQQRSRLDGMFSTLMTSMSEAILTVDAGGIVTNVNAAAAKLIAVSRYEAVGRKLVALFPGSPELVQVLDPSHPTRTYDVTLDATGGRSLAVTRHGLHTDEHQGFILSLRERRELHAGAPEATDLGAAFTFDDIIGRSARLLEQLELGRMAAAQSSRVLITGETGTGKELFAQAIHNASPRRRGPFVALNCAAIPRELMESEIFGYRGGAFTGSRKSGQIGKLELADGGTLFLDEISQLPLDLQSKLLRVLQDSTVTRLGDQRPVRVDVRIIAATNEDLYEKSARGDFRLDLYYRLGVIELTLPPLRERTEDLPAIADTLLRGIAQRLGQTSLRLSDGALSRLQGHDWPGNIRELENVLEMAGIVCAGDVIAPEHLAMRTRGPKLAAVEIAAPAAAVENSSKLRELELSAIRSAMRRMQGNVAGVSRSLGISRSTIYRRMKECGIVKSVHVE
jgi:sigma-54 dependent transcriptional regulator, acetoin dehydrogenase operon transcriptional activator AcoR